MLTFAISLLFTLGAAFAILVMVAMLAVNHRTIRSALAGRGAFAGEFGAVGTRPPLLSARTRVGPIRPGRRAPALRPAPISPLRAAA